MGIVEKDVQVSYESPAALVALLKSTAHLRGNVGPGQPASAGKERVQASHAAASVVGLAVCTQGCRVHGI